MKIGILTLPLETNYGGILQAYALQKTLKKRGYEVFTIDWHNPRNYASYYKNLRGWIHRLYLRFIKNKDVSVCWNPYMTDMHYHTITKNTRKYVENNLSLTKVCTPEELSKVDAEYSFTAYVVGSDQVWVNSYSNRSFLDFVKRKDVLRIAYAASSNENSWLEHPENILKIKELSKKFKALSTREESLASRTSSILNRKVNFVLDPTFLLEAQDYLETIKDDESIYKLLYSKDFIFQYILDYNKNRDLVLNIISNSLNLPLEDNMPKRKYIKSNSIKIRDCIFPPVEQWIYKIHKAKYIITDSFHGTVFAILFNKPFITIENAERGSERFKSLLSLFGLESRLVTDNTTPSKIIDIINTPIDYDKVNTIISDYKNKSLNFLLESLEPNENIHLSTQSH